MAYARPTICVATYSALLMFTCNGCKVARPSWWNPGSAPVQQQRAAVFDPYVDNDAGPDVVGGRPREFAKPRPEPVRSRPLPNTGYPYTAIPQPPAPQPAPSQGYPQGTGNPTTPYPYASP